MRLDLTSLEKVLTQLERSLDYLDSEPAKEDEGLR